MEVRIETVDEIEGFRIRHVGPYNEVGPGYGARTQAPMLVAGQALARCSGGPRPRLLRFPQLGTASNRRLGEWR